MTNTKLPFQRKVLLTSLLASLALTWSVKSHEATITITDDSCSSWQYDGGKTPATLVCVPNSNTVPTTPPPTTPPVIPSNPPTGTVQCAGYATTTYVPVPWPVQGGGSTFFPSESSHQGYPLKSGEALVFKFQVPYVNGNGRIDLYDYGGNGANTGFNRHAVASIQPCATQSEFPIVGDITGSISQTFHYTVGGNSQYYLNLKQGQPLYITVTGNCPVAGGCPLRLEMGFH